MTFVECVTLNLRGLSPLEIPIVVKADNVGALLMSQNALTGDNDSDIFTKNVIQEIYKKHAIKFLGSIEDFRSE
jgi:ligand-binding sensor protein